ncbi:MAG TPA: hypothetical protein VJT49_05200 [Amycolatopsis sp.]|uniref:hypothetical protein n=1 Tax=Amycolatopsis sp. TaxID=37632 RepID=UPI002B467B19|nr:hypothetical protein [Amycolatopsis sp.]HKS44504.1 hypothetical protein [Amycolatopsis sp.]
MSPEDWRVRKAWAARGADGGLLVPVDDGQPLEAYWGIRGERTPGLQFGDQVEYFDPLLGFAILACLRDILHECLLAGGQL